MNIFSSPAVAEFQPVLLEDPLTTVDPKSGRVDIVLAGFYDQGELRPLGVVRRTPEETFAGNSRFGSYGPGMSVSSHVGGRQIFEGKVRHAYFDRQLRRMINYSPENQLERLETMTAHAAFLVVSYLNLHSAREQTIGSKPVLSPRLSRVVAGLLRS